MLMIGSSFAIQHDNLYYHLKEYSVEGLRTGISIN